MNSIYSSSAPSPKTSFESDFQAAKLNYIQLHLGKNLNYFKSRADKLLKTVRKNLTVDAKVSASLSEIANCDIELLYSEVKKKHTLNFIAIDFGFPNWSEFKQWVEKVSQVKFSEFFCSGPFLGLTNIWFNIYSEAKSYQNEHGGVLLSYKTQFFIANFDIIRIMGFESEDEDWKAIGYDWVNPGDEQAKLRIVESILEKFCID